MYTLCQILYQAIVDFCNNNVIFNGFCPDRSSGFMVENAFTAKLGIEFTNSNTLITIILPETQCNCLEEALYT